MMENPGIILDPQAFDLALQKVRLKQAASGFCENITVGKNKKSRARTYTREGNTNIGGLAESSLHLVCKYYLEPDCTRHEVPVGKYVADIVRNGMAMEIQTGNFTKFKKKLMDFDSSVPICVVFPYVPSKRLIWTDPDSGESSGFRKSPKSETPLELLSQLVYLGPALKRGQLSFALLGIACDEYRLLCGWSRDRKKGSVRLNRVPTALMAADYFENLTAYLDWAAPGWRKQELTTSASLARETGLSLAMAQKFLYILRAAGLAEVAGKEGRFLSFHLTGGGLS